METSFTQSMEEFLKNIFCCCCFVWIHSPNHVQDLKKISNLEEKQEGITGNNSSLLLLLLYRSCYKSLRGVQPYQITEVHPSTQQRAVLPQPVLLWSTTGCEVNVLTW